MLTKYYVLILSINKSGGNSEEITRHDDFDSAENKFFDKCSQLAGNAQTGYVVIQMLDGYGRPIKTRTATIDRLPKSEPKPESEPEES